MKNDLMYLEHIIESIGRIKSYVKVIKDEDGFLENEIICDAVVRRIEIIGEAASKISSSLKAKNKQVPWLDIVDTRNLLIHGYFGVSYSAVWNVVKNHIPELEKQVKEILEKNK